MFRANDTQQITVYDSFLSQSAHIQRLIEKSWAKDFSDVIFPAIHEERFSVLYSSVGSRPNTPVNVLVGSMLLKEHFWDFPTTFLAVAPTIWTRKTTTT